MARRAMLPRSAILLLVALLLIGSAGCSNAPIEAKWADVSLYGSPPQIMFVYNDQVRLIDPVDGSPSELLDAEGEVRLDDQGNPRVWSLAQPGSARVTFYTRPIERPNGELFLAAYENKLFEVDGPSARWTNEAGYAIDGHVVATPLLNEDLLYVPLAETRMVALDSDSLDLQWTVQTERGVWATPLLNEGVLYVPSMDHNLYAVDADSGAELWRLDLGGAVASTPVLVGDVLYVTSFGRKLFKIDLSSEISAEHASDRIIAEYLLREWVWSAPAIVGDEIYVADLAGWVYALRDRGSSFELIWERQVSQRGIRPTPLVSDDKVVVAGRDQFVYWIDRATGEAIPEIPPRELRGAILSDLLLLDPAEIDGIGEPFVVVSTLAREQLLYAFTLDDGERKWQYPAS